MPNDGILLDASSAIRHARRTDRFFLNATRGKQLWHTAFTFDEIVKFYREKHNKSERDAESLAKKALSGSSLLNANLLTKSYHSQIYEILLHAGMTDSFLQSEDNDIWVAAYGMSSNMEIFASDNLFRDIEFIFQGSIALQTDLPERPRDHLHRLRKNLIEHGREWPVALRI